MITFFHATIQERHKFKSMGWNKPYKFTNVDNQISTFVIVNALNEIKGDEDLIPSCI